MVGGPSDQKGGNGKGRDKGQTKKKEADNEAGVNILFRSRS